MIGSLALLVVGAASSLQEFLEAADRGNLANRIAREQSTRASAAYNQAWGALLPMLSAQGAWTHNEHEVEATFPRFNAADPSAPPEMIDLTLVPKNQLDGILRVDLPLIDVSRWLGAAAASAGNAAAAARAEMTHANVERSVVGAYFGYAAALAVREATRKSLAVSEAQLELMQVRTQVGAATELELLRARAELERNRQTAADAVLLVASSKRALESLSGIEAADAVTLPDDTLKPEPPLPELEPFAEETPAVRAARHDAEAVEAFDTAARLFFVPSLAASFTERFSNATGFSGEDRQYAAGVTLTWRLDAPSLFRIGVAGAEATIGGLAAESVRNAARDQIHLDWHRLQAALTKVAAASAQVEAARRAAQMARDRYAAGAATQVDVIQAERDMFGAEVAQIQAKSELASAREWLALSTGLSRRR